MIDSSSISTGENKTLLNLFENESDKNESNIINMSNFFELIVDDILKSMDTNYHWQAVSDMSSLIGRISAAIKAGFDLNQMGVMVADYSHFGKDIIDGLKSGLYHVGESKEVAGNMRPAILDKKGHIVKWFTMKKAINPDEVLANVTSMSMQNSLRQISAELQGIGRDIKYNIEFARRQNLNLPFLNARSKFLNAINNPESETKYLAEAETYLLEGLNSLYMDIEAETKRLMDENFKPEKRGVFETFFGGSYKYVKDVLGRINEDMLMIPKYVAVKVYVLQYLGRNRDANYAIERYRSYLDRLANQPMLNSQYTMAQLIHEFYPYDKQNRDFWLDMPQKSIEALDSLKLLIDKTDSEQDLYLISTSNE